ncbi:MAG TPA: hypothetical protein VM054_00050 [bacterium]|nr:hypothetical protein [bacterium]
MKHYAPLLAAVIAALLLAGCEPSGFGKPPKLVLYELFLNGNPDKPFKENLLDVWLGNGEGWAVGPAGEDELQATVLFYDGTDWSIVEGPEGDLSAVLGDGDGGCIAVGPEGLMVRCDGVEWTRYFNLTYEDLTAVDGTAEDFWVVGVNGAVLHYADGGWTQTVVEGHNFTDVAATPGGFVAVTTDGSVVFGDDGGAEVYDLGVGGPLNGIADTDDGYLVVGDGGVILLGDTDDWTSLDSPTTDLLKDVGAASSEHFLAVGARGTVVLDDGGSLSLLDSPTDEDLTAVEMLSLSEGWIVGQGGVILHYY